MQIPQAQLRSVISELLRRAGSSDEEARVVTDHLVRANLAGHDSHGVGMIPTYVRHLGAKLLRPNTHAELIREDGPILVFDGGRGYGQVVAQEAMAQAIDRCKAVGVAVLGLRNAHHIGRIGTYGEQSINAGMVSLHFVNVTDHRPLVAPHRGTDARYSTNPICLAMPGTPASGPLLLDMATSKIALGKTRVAMNKNQRVADGMLLDSQGLATNEPSVMFRQPSGALLPLGEHKGYGLALFCELLAGVLTGAGTIQPEHERLGSLINNMLAVIIDPSRLVEHDWLQGEIDALVAYFKASPPADPSLPVLVAGEPERLIQESREREGIPIDPTTWEEILAAGEQVGLQRDEAEALVA